MSEKQANVKSSSSMRRKIAIILIAAVVLIGGIGRTFAYLTSKSDTVENTYQTASVTCTVNEANGTITNTGNIPARLRTAIVINWVDAAGGTLYVPASDYETVITAKGWTLENGYYYYDNTVPAGGSVAAPQVTVTTTLEGMTAKVTILAEVIQATPENAAQDAWGHNFGN